MLRLSKHESSRIAVYSIWFSITFKPWLLNIHNEVAAPKCFSVERAKGHFSNCRENLVNGDSGFQLDPENCSIRWLPRYPSGWYTICQPIIHSAGIFFFTSSLHDFF